MAEMQPAGRAHARRRRAGDPASQEPSNDRILNRPGDRTQHAGEQQRVEHEESVRTHAIDDARRALGTRPASTLPPSSGGTGIMLNTASSTFSSTTSTSRSTAVPRHGGPGSPMPRKGATHAAATSARSRLLNGPAIATIAKSRRGDRNAAIRTGTGLAHPNSGAPVVMASTGNRTVPIQSMCASGFSVRRPEHPRRRIAETIGRPCMRGLVKRQRQDKDDEGRNDDVKRRKRGETVPRAATRPRPVGPNSGRLTRAKSARSRRRPPCSRRRSRGRTGWRA